LGVVAALFALACSLSEVRGEDKPLRTARCESKAAAPSYSQALREANASGKPLVVLVGADWCPACVTLKDRVLPQLKKRGLLDHVVLCYLDYDRERELAEKITRGSVIPEMVHFAKQGEGWKVKRLIGGASVSQVEAFVRPDQGPEATLAANP
jgi:thioredoxin-like negative regulator of GroEL